MITIENLRGIWQNYSMFTDLIITSAVVREKRIHNLYDLTVKRNNIFRLPWSQLVLTCLSKRLTWSLSWLPGNLSLTKSMNRCILLSRLDSRWSRTELSDDDTFILAMSEYPSPNLDFKCWVLPRHWNRPFTIMASRVHNASHSSMLQQCALLCNVCGL